MANGTLSSLKGIKAAILSGAQNRIETHVGVGNVGIIQTLTEAVTNHVLMYLEVQGNTGVPARYLDYR